MDNSKLNHTENKNTETVNTENKNTTFQNTDTAKAEKQNTKERKPVGKPVWKKDVVRILAFIRVHIRYFSAGALLIVLILVLAMCAKPGTGGGIGQAVGSTEEAESGEESYEVDAYEEVNALISQYYTAYAAGDLATITEIATPVSANEQSYIALFSQYVDEYQNITCYTKSGLDTNSYRVFVAMEIKFTGVDTPAPGLDFFYLRTNDEGVLYIDNLYSQYNWANRENALDTSVQSLIYEFENDADIYVLQSEIQDRFDAALVADENLALIIQTTIPAAIKEWVAQVTAENALAQNDDGQTVEGTEEVSDTEENDDTTNIADNENDDNEDDGDEAEATTEAEQLATTDRVNVRAAADTSSEKLATLDRGTVVTRTGVEGDWSKIEYSGTTGYIKTEYLTYDTSDTSEDTDNSAEADNSDEDTISFAEGTVITVKSAVNIRSGMSEDVSKIGTAYKGEKVTVVMSYAEGWTKVKWNGETGYIKSSLLQ